MVRIAEVGLQRKRKKNTKNQIKKVRRKKRKVRSVLKAVAAAVVNMKPLLNILQYPGKRLR